MKICDGFISNSSSTSFLVASVPEENNLNLKTFEFLLSKIDNVKGISFQKTTVKNRKDGIKEEIKNYKINRDRMEKRVVILKKCSKNKAAKIIFDELYSNDKKAAKDPDIDYYKYDQCDTYKWDRLKSNISNYEQKISRINKRIEDLNKQAHMIKGLDDEAMVCAWEEDANNKLFSDLMDELVKDGRVKILENITT